MKKNKNTYYKEHIKADKIELKDGKRDTILKWIYDIHVVEWYITYLMRAPADWGDMPDIIQDIYLYLAEIPQEKWDDLYSQGYPAITAYVTGMIHRQLISLSSKTFKKYKDWHNKEIIQDDLFWQQYEENN